MRRHTHGRKDSNKKNGIGEVCKQMHRRKSCQVRSGSMAERLGPQGMSSAAWSSAKKAKEENLPIMALARFFNLTVEHVGGNTDFEGPVLSAGPKTDRACASRSWYAKGTTRGIGCFLRTDRTRM